MAGHRSAFLALTLGATLAAGAAVAETWRCEMRQVDSTGWISHRLEIQLASDGTARVFDSAIDEVFGAPIPGEITEDAGKRLKVRWIPCNLPVDAGLVIARPRYAAFLNRDTGRVSVSATLPVGDMLISGWGLCRSATGTSGFQPTSAPRRRTVIEIPFD